MKRFAFAVGFLAISSAVSSTALADPPSAAGGGNGAGPRFGTQHGQYGGPVSPEGAGVGVIVFRTPPGAAGVSGLGFENGRLTVAQGSAGQINLDALRAEGGIQLITGGGTGTGNNLRVRLEADGRLTVIGVNGQTAPLQFLGTTTTVDGSAAVLVRGAGTIGAEIGPNGVGANAGGELFAGARAEAQGTIRVPLIIIDLEIRVSGSANAGAGVSGSAGVQAGNGRVSAHLSGGVTLGVGGNAGVSVIASPGSMWRPQTRFLTPEERAARDRRDSLTGDTTLTQPRPLTFAEQLERDRIRREREQRDSIMGPPRVPQLPWAPSTNPYNMGGNNIPRLMESRPLQLGPSSQQRYPTLGGAGYAH